MGQGLSGLAWSLKSEPLHFNFYMKFHVPQRVSHEISCALIK